MILGYCKQLRKQLLLGPAILMGVALLWGSILAVVLFGFRESSAPSIGGIWFPAASGGYLFYLTFSLFTYRFPMTISMGIPRKTIFGLNLAVVLGIALVMLGLSQVFSLLEVTFLQSIADQRMGFDVMMVDAFGPWWISALIFLACLCIGLSISAILLRFGAGYGSKIFMLVWFACIFSQSLLDHIPALQICLQWFLPLLALAQVIWAIRQFFTMSL